MDAVQIILLVVLIYLFQAMLACFFNARNLTRWAKDYKDMIKLTFLPYVLIFRNRIRK